MMDPLCGQLLSRFLEDLRMRQIEFRNDPTIRIALELTIQEVDQRLKAQDPAQITPGLRRCKGGVKPTNKG